MNLSVFDFFKIGLGPSSSHTMGPMKAAKQFVGYLKQTKKFGEITGIRVELYGSLALTGEGHGTAAAVKIGLQGKSPDEVKTEEIKGLVKLKGHLKLGGIRKIKFKDEHIVFKKGEWLPFHPNGLKFIGVAKGTDICHRTYYSIGGGFVVTEKNAKKDKLKEVSKEVPNPFKSANELVDIAIRKDMRISDVIFENELTWRTEGGVYRRLRKIWRVMKESVDSGLTTTGTLPGKLKLERRAARMYENFLIKDELDSHQFMDYASICAIAVNEESADMRRVVTAPTNGAAGIVPAVMCYAEDYVDDKEEDWHSRFLLVAGAIAMLYKMNASISGAEVGCQGEVGVACSMAAGALTELVGGTVKQVEDAAEIGMEHNLGLTCDPIAGLVQIPCIERNAMGAVKAINASRMVMLGETESRVSLDEVIKTMKATGADMKTAYKETSEGGLAVNVTEC
jgi:L-serine dehydratase